MSSPIVAESIAEHDPHSGSPRRALWRLGRLDPLRQVLAAIAVIGASWFAWELVTNRTSQPSGDRFEQIDRYVTEQMSGSRIPGAALAIIEQGATVHARGFGNDGNGNDITTDTPFWIGSNTKSITALAVMQLGEAGAVDLDAPVREYLPTFRLADDSAASQITIRHLLNQTSGISRRPFGAADDARWHQGSLPNFTAWMVLLPDTDQAVIVMVNAGNQFEIGGANVAWSRIPQGIVNLLRDADPPTGVGGVQFFIVFTTLVALAVIAQAWTLVRVARGRRRHEQSVRRRAEPLVWELVVAPLVLVGYPAVAGGLGWRAAFALVPDLSFAVVAVAGLAVPTGLARAFHLARNRSIPRISHAPETPTNSPDPGRYQQ